MVEDAVEDDLDAGAVGRAHQLGELLVRAEERVDAQVVLRVIGVVAGSVEDGVEVDRRDAQALQVADAPGDAGQVAAEVVAAARRLGAGLGRVDVEAAVALRQRVPRLTDDAIQRLRRPAVARQVGVGVVGRFAVEVAVGEDLVHDRVLQPGDGGEVGVIDLDDVAPVVEVRPRLAPTAVALLVVLVVGRGRAVLDDEAVVVGRRRAGRQRRLPEVARLVRLRLVVAGHVGRRQIEVEEELPLRGVVPDAGADALDVVVVGAEAQDDIGSGRHRAEGHAVERVVAVVAQAVILDVVVVAVAQRGDGDGEGVGRVHEGEQHPPTAGRHGEEVVAAGEVGVAPVFAGRALGLPVAGVDGLGLEGVGAIVVRVGHPAAQAVGGPVAAAADLGLPVAHGDDDQPRAIADEFGLVVIVEFDGGARAGQGQVVGGVRLGPAVVQGRLVFLRAGGDVERALPDVVAGVIGQVGDGAGGVPVAAGAAGAAQLALEAAGNGNAGRGGDDNAGQQQAQQQHSCQGRQAHGSFGHGK